MKKLGTMFVCVLLAACGGGSKSGGPKAPAPEPTAESRLAEPQAATYAAPETTTAAPTEAEPAEAEPAMPVETAPAVAPQPAATMTATAEIKSIKDGSTLGTVTFEQSAEGTITINGQFTGLKKNGVHAFYIHENGDCGNKAKNVGGHLNPTKAKHGPPSSSTRHAGDFGNLTADDQGNASFSMETDSVTMEGDRADSILNRAIVIHAKKDDKKGNAGPAIACGVIQAQ